MQTVTLKFDVSGQNLIAGDLTRYASNTVNYVKAVFDLDGNWNSFDSVRAVWSTDFECISTVLDSEGVCYVPQEVLKRTGNVMVNLVGSIAENDELTDRLTTYPVVALVINANAKVCGTETAEVTPSQFEQYVAMVVAEVEKVTGMTATAVALPEGSAPTAVYENGVLTLGIPKGDKGETGNGISSVEFNADYSLTFNFTESEPYTTPSIRGERGAHGYGIVSVEKIGTAGLVDTYQVNYEDSSVPPTTFTVTNGAKGDTGNGISSVTKTGTVGLVDTYRITFTNGGHYDFNVTNGAKGDTGATGNGIATIAKTSTSGLVDTYTITFTDGTSTTFEVTNGADGEITEDNLQGSLEDMLSGYSISNGNYDSNNEPYTFRKSGGGALVGVREDLELVGGSVAWNQQAPNTELTGAGSKPSVSGARIVKGHKYLFGAYLDVDEELSTNAYISPYGFDDEGNVNTFCVLSGRSKGDIYKIGECAVRGVSDGTGSNVDGNFWFYMNAQTGSFKNLKLFDLTQMFGSTIADYIYSLEQATAGAGVAWFKKLFPKPYYAYNAGELMSVQASSHDMVGFNQWDEEWETGYIDVTTGNNVSNSSFIRGKNFIPVFPSTKYYSLAGDGSDDMAILYYDADKNYLNSYVYRGNDPFTTPSNCHYIRFYMASGYGTTYNNDICINLSWDGERDGEYEAYVKHSYPLDSSLTLRGIPKLDANNNLYYDGDTYESDGSVTRKYGVVDLGTLTWQYFTDYNVNRFAALVPNLKGGGITSTATGIKGIVTGLGNPFDNRVIVLGNLSAETSGYDKIIWGYTDSSLNASIAVKDTAYTDAASFKTAMSGVYLVYELATPTTETADTFVNPQIVDDFGTEEYITTSIVPVGHSTKYPPDDLGKLDMLANIPSPPNNNGTYTLEVTVLNGNTTYIWV